MSSNNIDFVSHHNEASNPANTTSSVNLGDEIQTKFHRNYQPV
ncbi:MAG: hypothetical protein R2784_02130 [Saprospiraceae bacterium]